MRLLGYKAKYGNKEAGNKVQYTSKQNSEEKLFLTKPQGLSRAAGAPDPGFPGVSCN
jgi:uncharacterized protein with PIN domain